MKKLVIASFASLFAFSMQTYANDTVHFDISVTGMVTAASGLTYDPEFHTNLPLVADYENPSSYVYRFQVTNQYNGINDIVPYTLRQIQKGPFTMEIWQIPGSRVAICTGEWQHDFWKVMDGKHDRFYLTLSPPCKVSPANNPNDPESGLRHNKDTYSVTYDTSLLK